MFENLPQGLASRQLRLRFFDVTACIRSDSGAYIDIFQRMYARFQANGASASAQPPTEFVVLTQPHNPWGRPVLILDGDVWPLRDPDLRLSYVYDLVLNTIIARVQSHFLIHAGVATNKAQGLIVAADSHHGKTTLVLELIRRRFRFLSDEMAALGREDRLVYPFPRSLRVRPDTLNLVGFPRVPAGPTWMGKLLFDIEELQPSSMGGPASIDHIIILKDPAEQGDDPEGGERELGVLVDRLDNKLLEDISDLEGISHIRRGVERGYPALRFRAADRMGKLSQIEALCRKHETLILDISKRAEGQPSFETPARLASISRSQAVMELLRRFQGGHKSALLQQEFGGSSTRLFMELADLIGRAACYRLYVGPLQEMADLVCGLVCD
jgi:hypothetical protein